MSARSGQLVVAGRVLDKALERAWQLGRGQRDGGYQLEEEDGVIAAQAAAQDGQSPLVTGFGEGLPAGAGAQPTDKPLRDGVRSRRFLGYAPEWLTI